MKKFGGSTFLGMLIASSLVYPGFLDGSITATFAEAGGLNFFGIPFSVPTAGYASSVMPIIAMTAVAALLERQLKRIIPDVVKLFLVPFFTALIVIPAGFLIIGPVMNFASDALGQGLLQILDFNPLIFGLLVGGLWQILVIFGLHWALVPFAIMAVAKGDPTPITAAANAASFAQTGAVAAIMLKTKDAKLRQLSIPAFISGWFGVTEPAIYGITLPRKRPFYISCIVAGLAGGLNLALGNLVYSTGGLGIFSFPNFINHGGDVRGAIAAAIIAFSAVGLSFVLTWMVGFKDDNRDILSKEDKKSENKSVVATSISATSDEVIVSPLAGKVLPLSEAKDAAFAAGVMGKGAVIEPTLGEVYAPFDGQVMTVFPTKHAIGLISEQGTEVLIHVGIDTVQLEGKYFETFIAQGQEIKKGDLLLKFDIAAIEEAGYSTQVPIIITNSDNFLDILMTDEETASKGEILLIGIAEMAEDLIVQPV